jgi:hypothetical protein
MNFLFEKKKKIKNRSDSLVLDSEHVTGVRSCYDEGKRTAETLTMDYHRGAGVEVSAHMLVCCICISEFQGCGWALLFT